MYSEEAEQFGFGYRISWVEEAYPVQPDYFHRSQERFFSLSSSLNSELNCTDWRNANV